MADALKEVRQVCEIPAILHRECPNWVEFPVFRNVHKPGNTLDGYLFAQDGELANGLLEDPTTGDLYDFSRGSWLQVVSAAARRDVIEYAERNRR